MKNRFEQEAITKPTTAEVYRLTRLFGGDLSSLDKLPTLAPGFRSNDWSVDPGIKKNGLLELGCNIGSAALAVDFGDNMFFINWYAALPPFLYPKKDIQSYLDFRSFAFEDLPQMLWFNTEKDSRPRLDYLSHSVARVGFRGTAVSRRYDLGDEKGRIGLELDFIDRSEKIKTVTIDGRPNQDPDSPGYFHLRLDYRGANDPETKVSLGFKLDDFGLQAFNPELVEWALEANENVDKIAEPMVAAHNLVDLVNPTLQAQIELARIKKGLV